MLYNGLPTTTTGAVAKECNNWAKIEQGWILRKKEQNTKQNKKDIAQDERNKSTEWKNVSIATM